MYGQFLQHLICTVLQTYSPTVNNFSFSTPSNELLLNISLEIVPSRLEINKTKNNLVTQYNKNQAFDFILFRVNKKYGTQFAS